jgi:hypothetical protein
MSSRRFVAVIVLLVAACTSLVSFAQMPLAPHSGKGQTVTPVFEGWYRNPDGTHKMHVLPAPARLENFQPHMHMCGKAMSMEAIYPDGRQELLSHVNNFQWNWHVNYVYADHVAPLLPKGTTLVITAWHDNTMENPNNPDPEQWVGWGDRTVHEMAHAWVDVTYLEQEDYEMLVAERASGK